MKRTSILGLGILVAGCVTGETALQGGRYSTNLEECNRTAKTLCESIACENHYRAAAGRFPRTVPEHCKTVIIKDAGTE